MEPDALLNWRTKRTISSRLSWVTTSSAATSTPRVVEVPAARAFISLMLPRTTAILRWESSVEAVWVRSLLAPAPTGSSTMGWPSCSARALASTMARMDWALRVPMLTLSAPQIDVMSSTSSGSSLMMGEPPAAMMTLATSCTVT